MDSHPADGGTPSLEVLKQRAWRRLIGAALLVGAAILCFPLLFSSQPRPLSQDIPIQIPDRPQLAGASGGRDKPMSTAAPSDSSAPSAPLSPEEVLPPAVSAAATAPAVSTAAVAHKESAPAPSPAAAEVKKSDPRSDTKESASGTATTPAKPSVQAKPQAERAIADKSEQSKSAKTAAQEKQTGAKGAATSPNAKASKRYVIQAGAYSDAAKLREARSKLEKAGLKTYVQVVEGKEGKRTRVRVGPFESKEALDKAVRKIKALDLPAGVIELP